MLLLLRFLRFYVFFENPQNVTFYVFLLCFTRFLELCMQPRCIGPVNGFFLLTILQM